MTELSFPRQHARTQRFALGAPRSVAVAADGARVVFLRSRSGTDRAQMLWVLDVAGAPQEGAVGAAGPAPAGGTAERIVADPAALLEGGEERLSAAERARRERSREGSAGIVGYALDESASLAAFALSGRLFVAGLRPGDAGPRELTVPGPVVDPRPSPDGRLVAYAVEGALRVVEIAGPAGERDRALAEPDGESVTWGMAEFIAAEEMGRSRGFWWAPDSSALLVARVDESPVERRWIAEPAHPDRAPVEVAYPLAGTANAIVTLWLLGLDGSRREVPWDRERYPYLAAAHWSAAGAPLLLVQARDQREQRYLTVDPATGATAVELVEEDQIWLDLFPGSPTRRPDGTLVRMADLEGARVLMTGDKARTGPELHVREVLHAGADDVLVTASAGEAAADPATGQVHVYRVDDSGAVRVSREPGLHTAVRSGGLTVLISAVAYRSGTTTRVLRGSEVVAEIANHAETPSLTARPRFTEAGPRRIPAAVLLPTGYTEGDGPLPVLLDPYGGPHGQRVVAAQNAHLVSQWFADQGFAVIVADGRGTPGRSPGWEKAIAGQLAAVTLEDQIAALQALAPAYPLDLGRVAIRGWSYGGSLAAWAVLRRPDVFHAAVVGAPLTEQRLYDTHYTERYLGLPDQNPEAYDANSVVTADGIVELADQARPLMIIHGLADDNVLVANSLRLSSALLAAGRPHEVLPLSGVTHMTPQEQVAENLLLLQVDFLKRSLGLDR